MQRLLERNELTLDKAFDRTRSLEMAEKQSHMYRTDLMSASIRLQLHDEGSVHFTITPGDAASAATVSSQCYFCGYKRHPRIKCPARDDVCKIRGKRPLPEGLPA